MAFGSSSIVKNQGKKVRNVQLVKSDTFPQPKYHVIPKIIMKGDSIDVLSLIPPMLIMIHDV